MLPAPLVLDAALPPSSPDQEFSTKAHMSARALLAENEVVPSFAQQPLRWMDFAVLILEK